MAATAPATRDAGDVELRDPDDFYGTLSSDAVGRWRVELIKRVLGDAAALKSKRSQVAAAASAASNEDASNYLAGVRDELGDWMVLLNEAETLASGAGWEEAARMGAQEPDDSDDGTARDSTRAMICGCVAADTLAVNLSLAVNVCLLVIKLVASIMSGSIAVVGSALDSALDVLAGVVIFMSTRASRRTDLALFPVGRARLEPLYVLIFAVIMGASAVVLLRESITILANGFSAEDQRPDTSVDEFTYGVFGAVIVVKGMLFVFCRIYRAESVAVQALAQDHFNDIISNIVAVAAVAVSASISSVWFLDPLTASLIALYILHSWLNEGKEIVRQLAGLSATPQLLNALTRRAWAHHEDVDFVDTIRAYYSGARTVAEVDIGIDQRMKMRVAHDIGETLQRRLERLGFVERAYTHLDWSYEHSAKDEHIVKLPDGTQISHAADAGATSPGSGSPRATTPDGTASGRSSSRGPGTPTTPTMSVVNTGAVAAAGASATADGKAPDAVELTPIALAPGAASRSASGVTAPSATPESVDHTAVVVSIPAAPPAPATPSTAAGVSASTAGSEDGRVMVESPTNAAGSAFART